MVGLPYLSQTTYAPALPDIAHQLKTSEKLVEYSLMVYLWGIALGALFWGRLSDHIGRKPCIYAGIFLAIAANSLVLVFPHIESLIATRFMLGFGAAVGNALTQTITRDSFDGKDLGRAYAIIGSSLSLYMAAGPAIGGFIDSYLHYSAIFVGLIVYALFMGSLVFFRLPETLPDQVPHSKNLMRHTFHQMIRDRSVVGYVLLVCACMGLVSSFHAEASFYFQHHFSLSAQEFGLMYPVLATMTFLAGLGNIKLRHIFSHSQLIQIGLGLISCGSAGFILSAFMAQYGVVSFQVFYWLCYVSAILMMMGGPIIMTNSLSQALIHYRHAMGTASALMSTGYTLGASGWVMLISHLHSHDLLTMPLFFGGLSMFAVGVYIVFFKKISHYKNSEQSV